MLFLIVLIWAEDLQWALKWPKILCEVDRLLDRLKII